MVFTETMTMLQTTMTSETNGRKPGFNAFTLFELIVVLAIISTMVTVILPYATRSNESLRIKQECLNIAEAVKYAIDLATDTKRPTRIVINRKSRSYLLEIADREKNQGFRPVEDFQGAIRYLGQTIHIIDVQGFNFEASDSYLIFDPAKQWPNASVSLAISDAAWTIKIRGKQVEIEQSAI